MKENSISKLLEKKILIVGSSGFLGKNLLKELQESKKESENLFTLNRSFPKQLASNKEFCWGNLDQLPEDIEIVFLLAAHIPYGRMNETSTELIEANIELPLKIKNKFPNAKIVFASSVGVYGTPLTLPITEAHPFNSPNAYGESKIKAEVIIQEHKDFSILRFSSLYGPGMKKVTFLPQIINSAIINKQISIYGSGERSQDYLHIKDAVQACLFAALEKNNNLINVASGKSFSNLQIAQIIQKLLPETTIERTNTNDPSPSFEYKIDKLKNLYQPTIFPEQGIQNLINSWQQF